MILILRFARLRIFRATVRLKTTVALFVLALSLTVSCSSSSGSQIEASPSVAFSPTISDELAIGINLANVSDWSTQLPFIDGFKSARFWIPQCDENEAGCSGGWGTDEKDMLDLDEHGWVKSLPAPDDPPEYTRVGTLLYREIEGQYPGGQYVVLYDGEGTIGYRFDAVKDEDASTPGRDVINVTPSGAGIYLSIIKTDPNKTGNYIRNIHVVPIEYENTFQSELFNPIFLERISKFKVLRFMDWMRTNDSKQSEWNNKPAVDDANYKTRGVPLEIMLELANRVGADPWFNMPHQATDDYITNFAQLVKEKLDPQRNVYVEFSNEVWNWQFEQAHYASEQGKERWGDKDDAFMQWYGMRSAQMSDLWKNVFAEQRDRVISVISTQTVWRGLENSVLECSLWVAEGNTPCYQHEIDAFAITGYFSGGLNKQDNTSTVESWADDTESGFSKAFTQIEQGGMLPEQNDTMSDLSDLFRYHKQVAQSRNLRLIAYEGGQHLVRPDNEKLTDFFIELNRQPEMHRIYTQLLEQWKNAGGGLFMHYSDISTPGKWGSWGALEHVDQEHSPKYDALIEFIDRNSIAR